MPSMLPDEADFSLPSGEPPAEHDDDDDDSSMFSAKENPDAVVPELATTLKDNGMWQDDNPGQSRGTHATDDKDPRCCVELDDQSREPSDDTKSQDTEEASGFLSRCRAILYSTIGCDRETLVFGVRVASSMTLASLFTLAFPLESPYPNAFWILTSAGIVAWQEYLDTASALKKAVECMSGTVGGAGCGLVVGLLAESAKSTQAEVLVLGSLIAMGSFAFAYISTRTGQRGSYAARLGIITFGIVALSFYSKPSPNTPIYMTGLLRAANMVIGCLISCFSVFLWPESTKHLIADMVKNQMRLAGDSADTVLSTAFEALVNKQSPPHFQAYMRAGYNIDEDADAAFRAHYKGVSAWKTCNALFASLKYDPLFRALSRKEQDRFQETMSIRVYRVFRLQVNLVLLDSIVRAGVQVDAYSSTYKVLCDVGRRAKIILNLDNDMAEREATMDKLVENDLVKVRCILKSLRKELSEMNVGDADVQLLRQSMFSFDGSPLRVLEGREQMTLFFHLVEHLIIRVSRLHYFASLDMEASYLSTSS